MSRFSPPLTSRAPRKAKNRNHYEISGLGVSIALYGLSTATFLACLLFPLISSWYIEPYVVGVYGQTASMSAGNLTIMMVMMVMVLLFPLSFLNYGRGVRVTDAYLGGGNLQSSIEFRGSTNRVEHVSLNNYYLRGFFSEAGLSRWGAISAAALLMAMLAFAAFVPTTGAEVQSRRLNAPTTVARAGQGDGQSLHWLPSAANSRALP